MSIYSQRTILVATDEGFHLFNGTGTSRVDDFAGRDVRALAFRSRALGDRRGARGVAEC